MSGSVLGVTIIVTSIGTVTIIATITVTTIAITVTISTFVCEVCGWTCEVRGAVWESNLAFQNLAFVSVNQLFSEQSPDQSPKN